MSIACGAFVIAGIHLTTEEYEKLIPVIIGPPLVISVLPDVNGIELAPFVFLCEINEEFYIMIKCLGYMDILPTCRNVVLNNVSDYEKDAFFNYCCRVNISSNRYRQFLCGWI